MFERGVKEEFDKWGDDARAIVRAKWNEDNGGCGHFVSARRDGDKIVYEDPQTGTVRGVAGTLEKCSPPYGDTWLMRADDRKLISLVKEAVENA